jgi:chaperonin cofactor prefoldin
MSLMATITTAEEKITISAKEIVERLTRLEEGQKALNKRIDDINKRIDGLQGWLYVIVAGIITIALGMGGCVVMVFWAVKTALLPTKKRTKEIEEKEELLERALKEYAKVEPKMAEVLKTLKII